jgi:hypothetical protein
MFIVYKTTNLLTSEYYIGVHKTISEIFDGYYGSGRRIIRSVKKYGKDNFVRSTLHSFDDSDEKIAFAKEAKILMETLHDPLCLNIAEGGKGGSNFKGHRHTEETKKLLSQKSRAKKPYKPTSEDIDKAKATRIRRNGGKYFSDETLAKLSVKSKNISLSVREQISQTLINYYNNHENRMKQSISVKLAYSDPAVRARHKQAMQEYYQNPDNRRKKSEQMRVLDKECDLDSMKADYDSGLRPKQIMEKYGLTKNRYDHLRAYYLKNKTISAE